MPGLRRGLEGKLLNILTSGVPHIDQANYWETSNIARLNCSNQLKGSKSNKTERHRARFVPMAKAAKTVLANNNQYSHVWSELKLKFKLQIGKHKDNKKYKHLINIKLIIFLFKAVWSTVALLFWIFIRIIMFGSNVCYAEAGFQEIWDIQSNRTWVSHA